MRRNEQKFLRFVWLTYILFMLWLLFGQRMRWYAPVDMAEFMEENLNLEPFHTIRLFTWVLKNSENINLIRLAYINLAGNVAMFIPLGFFLPAVCAKLRRFWPFFVSTAVIIILIELTQLLTQLGTCDIDDLILNLIGCTVGYCVFRIIYAEKGKRKPE